MDAGETLEGANAASAGEPAEESGRDGGSEQASEPEHEPRTEAGSNRKAASASAVPTRQAPPFWMVLAIAGISLVLGVVIGYLIGTSATIAELSANAGQSVSASDDASDEASLSMPEGHPEVDVDEEGNATVVDGSSATGETDTLSRANTYFDMGMAAMEDAQDESAQQQAADLFAQAVELYDEYLETTDSPSAEVDRAICVFYTGDHDAAIADWKTWWSVTTPSLRHGRTSACSTNRTGIPPRPRKRIVPQSTLRSRMIRMASRIMPSSASTR